MCKILYFDGSSSSVTLRAVMPLADLKSLFRSNDLLFVSDSYSDLTVGREPETFIEVTVEEQQAEWRAGFYATAKKPLDFEDCLRSLCG